MTTNLKRTTRLIKIDSQEGPKVHRKSMKIKPGPQGVPFGVPVDPWVTKMVTQGQKSGPQGTKMEPQGLPNHSFGSSKSSCQQSTCQQLPVQRGAGGRGEALRYPPRFLKLWEATAGVSRDTDLILLSLHSLLHTHLYKFLAS